MLNDFFLMERAAQIQRLRVAKAGNHIDIPGRMSRFGHSRRARQLFHTIDQICAIPLREKRARWLARFAERGLAVLGLRRSQGAPHDTSLLLTPPQRDLLAAFERQAVAVELDEGGNAPAIHSVAAAILHDSAQFNGLKPMPYHADDFAYELLFPSWLNLYSVLNRPAPETSEPRFSCQQVRTLFTFLDQYEADAHGVPDLELLGALTLVAHRCPAGHAQVVIQQLMNVCRVKGHDPSAFAATISRLRERNDSAHQFLHVLKSWIVVETSALSDLIQVNCDLGVETPLYRSLPEPVTRHIRGLEGDERAYERWVSLLEMIARFCEQGGQIAPEYAAFLETRTDDVSEWLSFLCPREGVQHLPAASQRLLVKMAVSPGVSQTQADLRQLFAFARIMAPRLHVLHGPYLALFEKEFVENHANRAILLRCADDDLKRRTVAQNLLAQAKKSSDRNRILGRMIMAAIIDPEYDSAKLAAVGRTTSVLTALEEKGFISPNQLEDLASDIARRLPESTEFLAAPFKGALDQEERRARLYLALYEECEKFEQSGEIGNFGLTMAAYGTLNRSIVGEAERDL
ncbi:MAG: hypothetical protein MUF48_18795 [Pirellulaceae bacterium]|jgi:hypothetical protein|nr:hypothetical protein [Pirellulaceae bacterium]